MKYYKCFKFRLVLIIVLFFLFTSLAISEEESYDVLVTPNDGKPMKISDFRNYGLKYYWAIWRGSKVKISFKDIELIQFLEPGNDNYPVEISFKDGRVDKFFLRPNHNYDKMYGKSDFGNWNMHHKKAVSIDFRTSSVSQNSNLQQLGKFDAVQLKNGDIISGSIQNTAFKLNTSYGDLIFKTNEINNIDFEGGGQNIDVITLKIGDKLSGIIKNKKIKIALRSGTNIEIDKEKIKTITIKN